MPTKKEHYVPRFIINNFADKNGKVKIIDKNSKSVCAVTRSSDAVLFENNLYETKNLNGSFYKRNEIENKFARIEGHISQVLKCLHDENGQDRRLTGEEQVAFGLLVSLQLVRLPHMKRLIEDNPTNTLEDVRFKCIQDNAMYRMMIDSRESGIAYLKENGVELSTDAKDQLQGQSFLDFTTSYILSNCAIYILIAPDNNPYVLCDKPVLIDRFADAKYIFLVAPRIAICCSLIEYASEKEFGGFINGKIEWIEKINSSPCKNANRFIVCPCGFESRVVERLEGKE